MRKYLRKIVPNTLLKINSRVKNNLRIKKQFLRDKDRFIRHGFSLTDTFGTFEQLEARITKAYHSIEKGLSYNNIRLGFGKKALNELLDLMVLYKKNNYPLDSECYRTALSNLEEYIDLHEQNNFDIANLKNEFIELGGISNKSGGVKQIKKEEVLNSIKGDFQVFSNSRHSIRDFSQEPVEISLIEKALELAQNTPSACNRQAWKARIIAGEKHKEIITNNQNGNAGFGDKVDKYILITTDLQYFAKPRERNQSFIDGGMYAMNLLYGLHYNGLATIPLSASLTDTQESAIRQELDITESENFILIIGVGNYSESCKIPKSTRRSPKVRIY